MTPFEKLVLRALSVLIRLALPARIQGYQADALKLADELDRRAGGQNNV